MDVPDLPLVLMEVEMIQMNQLKQTSLSSCLILLSRSCYIYQGRGCYWTFPPPALFVENASN
ncbi:hypothetical protein Scep_000272 [Stephania cephalantha]|uniref:Uncharacterized protein n=1 Tax=Stephania cephalantha TaxID=152367 RepID=A0AAP0L624_9MAGN